MEVHYHIHNSPPPVPTLAKSVHSSAHHTFGRLMYRGADKSLARPGREQLISPAFMELGGSLPHSQQSTTFPYPSQINPYLCPSHFWQAQLVSFLVGLRTYQHPCMLEGPQHVLCLLYLWTLYCRGIQTGWVPWEPGVPQVPIRRSAVIFL